jgi:glyoxylate reductase
LKSVLDMTISMSLLQRSTMSPCVAFLRIDDFELIPKVTHTPGAVDDATATVAIYLVISAMRQFAKAEVACRNLEWKKNLPLARDPEQKTIGIVGMGGIGTVVARRMALGWGMRVLYHNRSKLAQEPTDFSVEYKSSLEDLLAEADIISLHIPVSSSDWA